MLNTIVNVTADGISNLGDIVTMLSLIICQQTCAITTQAALLRDYQLKSQCSPQTIGYKGDADPDLFQTI